MKYSPAVSFCFYSLTFVVWRVQATFWMENIPRLGSNPFGNIPNYQVYRNVKSFGAVGDGVTDDTAAINNAVASPFKAGGVPGNGSLRCGEGVYPTGRNCESTTISPALIYFPPGNYLISRPIMLYYFTQVIGDANALPTIIGAANYSIAQQGRGVSMFDSNPYIPGYPGEGLTWAQNQVNFYRQIRNFNFDLTLAPNSTSAIHWQVAQATQLQNINIKLAPKTQAGNRQVGVNMENGSGGFFSDITVTGGYRALSLGSQQFTTRNIKVDGASTAFYFTYVWTWTLSQITITNCDVGFDLSSGSFTAIQTSAIIIMDSVISATLGILSLYAPGFSSPQAGGTLMLERVDFTGSPRAIAASTAAGARLILAGNQYVQLFGQGNAWTTASADQNGQVFNGTTCSYQNNTQNVKSAQELTIQRTLAPITRPASIVDSNGNIVVRSHPQYENIPFTGFLSAKSSGLVGDGLADDTVAMQNFFNTASATNKIAYFDHGAYLVSNTVQIPKDLKITGELWPLIMATGSNFADQFNPRPMWRVGNPGDAGTCEISDVMFETKGPAPGAILVEWNIAQSYPGGAGMWEAHYRIGGSAGTQLQQTQCLKDPSTPLGARDPKLISCSGAFLLLHITSKANAYIENVWGWISDHELDELTRDQVDIFSGRGVLIEGNGPNWLWGTAFEHSALYDYQVMNGKNTWMGHIQHETAYYQGNPPATRPFTPQPIWGDPLFNNCTTFNCPRTWALRIINSTNIYTYGAGFYSFFNNWDAPTCLAAENCQYAMVDFQNSTDCYIWTMSTKGSEYMVSWEGTALVPEEVNKASYTESILVFEFVKTQ